MSPRRVIQKLPLDVLKGYEDAYGVPPIRFLMFTSMGGLSTEEFGASDQDKQDDWYMYNDNFYQLALVGVDTGGMLGAMTANNTLIAATFEREVGPWVEYHHSTGHKAYSIMIYVLMSPCTLYAAVMLAKHIYVNGIFTGFLRMILYVSAICNMLALILIRYGERRSNVQACLLFGSFFLGFITRNIVIAQWLSLMRKLHQLTIYERCVRGVSLLGTTIVLVGTVMMMAGLGTSNIPTLLGAYTLMTKIMPGVFLLEGFLIAGGATYYISILRNVRMNKWTKSAIMRMTWFIYTIFLGFLLFAVWNIMSATPVVNTIPGYVARSVLVLLSEFVIFVGLFLIDRVTQEAPDHADSTAASGTGMSTRDLQYSDVKAEKDHLQSQLQQQQQQQQQHLNSNAQSRSGYVPWSQQPENQHLQKHQQQPSHLNVTGNTGHGLNNGYHLDVPLGTGTNNLLASTIANKPFLKEFVSITPSASSSPLQQPPQQHQQQTRQYTSEPSHNPDDISGIGGLSGSNAGHPYAPNMQQTGSLDNYQYSEIQLSSDSAYNGEARRNQYGVLIA
ncbi:hypothetical protein GQ42DRAFT_162433 [Ramicandelaber brevisporus]|nr:hypothetical protein GQ42DRAFT_162433 [Ramicandelaber brevisporus]